MKKVIKQFFEFIYLNYLRLYVKGYDGIHQLWVKIKFYHDKDFAKLDKTLLNSLNPYQISEAFPYGETPFWTLYKIGLTCQLTPKDVVVDLGCGRGRGVFFLSHSFGSSVIGIDRIKPFIQNAQMLSQQYPHLRVSFIEGDLQNYDFSKVSCVFLYGTGFSDKDIHDLCRSLKKLPPQSQIVTISYPLEGFQVTKIAAYSFPWGRAEVYFHIT